MGVTQIESQPCSKILFTTDCESPSQSRLTLKNLCENHVLFKVKIKYPGTLIDDWLICLLVLQTPDNNIVNF